jgi:4-hydroxybutyrate dehydrogenase
MALIYDLTHVHLDFGTRELLPAQRERIGIKKPLIVTDAGVRAAGVLQRVLDALPASLQGAIYDRTPSNPIEAAVREAAAMYREHGCDGLIAVSGGSSLDCAKVAAIAATHPGPLVTYATIEGGSGKIAAAAAQSSEAQPRQAADQSRESRRPARRASRR